MPTLNSIIALSPDGTTLALTPWPDGPVVNQHLDALNYQPLEATKNGDWRQGPQFSPQ